MTLFLHDLHEHEILVNLDLVEYVEKNPHDKGSRLYFVSRREVDVLETTEYIHKHWRGL